MTAVFDLNHEKLAGDLRFAEIAVSLSDLSPIDSEETFNRYCREACRLWTSHFRNRVGETSARFPELLEKIERRGEGMHHVGYAVADVTEALAEIGATGVRLIDSRPRHGSMGASIAFLHPAYLGGVLTELVQPQAGL